MRWWAELPGKVLGPMFALDAVRVGRRMSTFVTRWVYLLGLTLVLGIFFYGWTNRMSSTSGVVPPSVLSQFAEEFFWLYAVTQFLVVVALTPSFTASAITDEKERKTLDFLLVTDLSAREIVLGKLASRAGLMFTLVLAGLPILSLIQLFGGIDPELLLFAAGMTLATVVSMAAVGVACSVLLSRTRDAVVLAYVLPLVYVVGSSMWAEHAGMAARFGRDWSFHVMGKYTITGNDLAQATAAANPFLAVGAINGRTGVAANSGATVAWYCGAHLLVALVGFAVAALRLRGVARAAGGAVAARGTVRRFLARLGGHRTEARHHPPVTDQPVAWREVYVEPGSGSGVLRTFLRFAVIGVIAFSFFRILIDTVFGGRTNYYGYESDPLKAFQLRTKLWVCWVTGALSVLMLLGATVRGAASVAGEKDRDTWTNLLTTPLTAAEILWGKWWGCVWGQRHAVYLLGGVWFIGVVSGSVHPFALVLAGIALGAYLWAFAWLGVASSVSARSARAAITRAMPQAIFYGGGFWVFLACCCVAGAAGGGGAMGDAVAHAAGFILGFTPPVVLAGLPAIDSEVFKPSGGRRAETLPFIIAAGGVCGTLAWMAAGAAFKKKAHDLIEREANRRGNEQPPDPYEELPVSLRPENRRNIPPWRGRGKSP